MPGPAINPNIKTVGTHGLLRVISPDGLRRMEAEERKKNEDYQATAPISSLAANLRTRWDAALRAKQAEIDERLLKCRRQRNGEYDPDVLAEINKFGGSTVFMLLTSVKCRAAAAWIRDVLMPPGEKPWSIDPTPLPKLPDQDEAEIQNEVLMETRELMFAQGIGSVKIENIRDRLQELLAKRTDEKIKQAKLATTRFERKIEDEFQEGSFYKALVAFIEDLVTYPTAFICGPELRRRKTMAWRQQGDGTWQPQIVYSLVREYRRVSPFDLYPAPSSKTLQDGYLFERVRLRRKDLLAMIGVPGFNEFAIRQVLRDYGKGYREWLSTDQERAQLESRSQEQDDPDPPIDALCYWGSVRGQDLIDWGMKNGIKDPLQEYDVNAWLVGRYVICARLNPHPLGNKPYWGTSYELVADSIWGRCPPELMRDVQRICNGIARAIVNNAGIASGPLVEISKDRMVPGQDYTSLWPWKVLQTKDDKFGHGKPAIQFYQPNMLTEALLKIYEYFFNQASEQVGIPTYMYGNQETGGGGGDTATGLSMLMNNASKALKAVITHIDDGIIKPIVYEHWVNIMLFDDDELKCGDINVVARASEYLLMQESYQLRRLEYLKNTNNPIDMAIIGLKGRAALHREVVKSLKLNEDIIPSKDEMEAAANPAGPGGESPVLAQPGAPGMIPPPGVTPAIQPPGAAGQAVGPGGFPPGEQMRKAA
jgi:hypothetical protein